ncbi:MAG TPA: transketolase family protein [Nitrospinota bacterium]|nr:transketolase family protein [Nitrospinota bacterium]|tara:strand:- start:24662 stop:25642 length:981 start_codon:yes stop_codon:yes gene_type:complete
MSKKENLSLRDAYGETLVELGGENPHVVVLDADLSGSTRTSKFAKKFPDRFFNIGIAEADMMSTAAGLAVAGKIPFASTFAVFASGRAWDQVRQSICFSKLNVKIVASHGGITVGEDGPTHHAMEDLALMRVMPNLTVIVPVDAVETASAIRVMAQTNGPMYLRTAREKFPVLYDKGEKFNIGKGKELKNGSDVAIIACGLMVSVALEAAEQLEQDGISTAVINMSTIKPIDSELILRVAATTGSIVTAEEHSIVGGLGSAVAEVVCENEPVAAVVRVGMKAQLAQSGKPKELLELYGMNKSSIVGAAHRAIALKREPAHKSGSSS